ncbi:hypothetical protein [Veronia pacifica]|uniref:Phage tail protein n=1 Tax=Veronia pacifica TaxID=1080227 RepID=A0A1C3E6J5_9GAMM|nr:hypothetical protein [Veronia pacifica]ODA28877.1 hypothetical protein A8L45_22945 [Veronia pacifica]
MQTEARKGELITDLIFKHTGQDNDAQEAAFYRLNPHVRGEVFTETTIVTLPAVIQTNNQRQPTRSWD